ncbi:MAG: hypothetical protein Q8P80_05590 [Candidatus Levybacteria bacterium]|nr:hypothetical protein [Candidatus Levybacteria bacterium]
MGSSAENNIIKEAVALISYNNLNSIFEHLNVKPLKGNGFEQKIITVEDGTQITIDKQSILLDEEGFYNYPNSNRPVFRVEVRKPSKTNRDQERVEFSLSEIGLFSIRMELNSPIYTKKRISGFNREFINENRGDSDTALKLVEWLVRLKKNGQFEHPFPPKKPIDPDFNPTGWAIIDSKSPKLNLIFESQ